MTKGRILTIQSHVVSGYVGNKAAVFPLQVAGYDVDALNTVQFSNHTGYPTFKGTRTDPDTLRHIFDALIENDLHRYDALLVGYIGSASLLACVKEVHQRLKEANPRLLFLLDPVMGDEHRGLYVDPALVPLYKSLIATADIITPNQFEAETLADTKITSLETTKDAFARLRSLTGAAIVITSVVLPADKDQLHLFAHVESRSDSQLERMGDVLQLTYPRLPEDFTGTGDCFNALLLSRWPILQPSGSSSTWQASVKQALATMQKVMQQTVQQARGVNSADKASHRLQAKELALIDSLPHLLHQ